MDSFCEGSDVFYDVRSKADHLNQKEMIEWCQDVYPVIFIQDSFESLCRLQHILRTKKRKYK
jgi:hypothetical protein